MAVKLGTITPNGGDVFSYDEDDMVIDSKLPIHLAHFGINIATMHKTDKTMNELQVIIILIPWVFYPFLFTSVHLISLMEIIVQRYSLVIVYTISMHLQHFYTAIAFYTIRQ